jgi:hypothetical protein
MDVMQQYPGHQIMIVNIGAGIVTMPLNSQKMSSWGIFSWLKPLLNLMLSSNVQYTEKSIDLYANASSHDAIDYYRFDVPVSSDHDSLSIDPNNLKYFVNLGQSMVKTNKNKLYVVCKRINADD